MGRREGSWSSPDRCGNLRAWEARAAGAGAGRTRQGRRGKSRLAVNPSSLQVGPDPGPSAVVDRDTLDLLAQVAVVVADEGLQQLPLVVLDPGADLGDEQAAGGVVPLDPAGVLHVPPPPLADALEGRVRAAEVPLGLLQQGLQPGLSPGPGDDLHEFHGVTSVRTATAGGGVTSKTPAAPITIRTLRRRPADIPIRYTCNRATGDRYRAVGRKQLAGAGRGVGSDGGGSESRPLTGLASLAARTHGGLVGRIEKYSMSSSLSPTFARTNSRSSLISSLLKTLRSLVTNRPFWTWPLSSFSFSTSSAGASRLYFSLPSSRPTSLSPIFLAHSRVAVS